MKRMIKNLFYRTEYGRQMSADSSGSISNGSVFHKGWRGAFLWPLILSLLLLTGCRPEEVAEKDSGMAAASEQTEEAGQENVDAPSEQDEDQDFVLDEDGSYTAKEDVAAYLNTYGHLPGNFMTKKEAKALGWDSQKGNLSEIAPGKSIGGDYFGNYEGILPEAEGREYHECDIDSDGSYRGAKRIVFSNDGLIYYTEDHYESFELLYGEE